MNANVYVIEDYENETTFRPKKTNPNKPNFKRGRLLIDPMLPLYPVRKPALRAQTVSLAHLITEPGSNIPAEISNGVYKLSNIQYYSRNNFKVKFPKISIISILRPAKLTKYRWKIMPAAAIFNPIKKLTITRTGANLKGRRVI